MVFLPPPYYLFSDRPVREFFPGWGPILPATRSLFSGFCAVFFGAGGRAFLQGFFRKNGCKLWWFDGQFVVVCVANVVS